MLRTTTNAYQSAIGLALIALMAVTRGHHFATLEHLPSASWAVFFLVGVYLRPLWALPLFLLEAFLLDVAAVTWGGVSNFCISPAYPMLVPAYACLWAAGRWFARRASGFNLASLGALVAAVVLGALACQIISSGSFYYLSGRYNAPHLAEFAQRLVTYTPRQLQNMAVYVGIAMLLHGLVAMWQRLHRVI